MDSARSEEPEYGPGGYLPPRAAQRARKIVLRERMGLGWPLAAVGAAVVIALAGTVFLVRWSSPPEAPWVPAGPLQAVGPGAVAVLPVAGLTDGALVVRAAGDVRAFAAPAEPVVYCRSSGRLESSGGSVWGLDGRLLSEEGASLSRLPVRVFDGVVYVNPADGERLGERRGRAAPGCQFVETRRIIESTGP